MNIDTSKTAFRRIRFDQIPEGQAAKPIAVDALTEAFKEVIAKGGEPVMMEVTIYAAAPEIDFDSDRPLVCDPNRPAGETCESCQ